MLISEGMFMLLTRDDGRTESWVTYRDLGLASALVADLALAGIVTFEGKTRKDGRLKNPRVYLAGEASGGAPSGRGPSGRGLSGAAFSGGDASGGEAWFGGGAASNRSAGATPDGPQAVMEFGIRALADRKKPPRLQTMVQSTWFKPRDVLGRSLVAQNIVEFEEARFFGLRPVRFPVENEEPERQLRSRLQDALGGRIGRDGRGGIATPDAVILGILRGMDSAKVVLKDEAAAEGLKGRSLNKRIEAILEELPEDAAATGLAIKQIIDGINASVTAAVAASTTAAVTAATS